MVVQKEEANGCLYQMSLYTTGYLPGLSPRRRDKRRQQTTEYKKKLNAKARLWRLMQIICANFVEMRDLFVCLTYAEAPTNEARCLEAFHRRLKRALDKFGIEHAKDNNVPANNPLTLDELREMDGEPVWEL